MNTNKAKMLSMVLTLAMVPTLSWAKSFNCAVYEKTINNGQGSEARQGDVSVEGDSAAEAVTQTRVEYSQWKDVARYEVNCREAEE